MPSWTSAAIAWCRRRLDPRRRVSPCGSDRRVRSRLWVAAAMALAAAGGALREPRRSAPARDREMVRSDHRTVHSDTGDRPRSEQRHDAGVDPDMAGDGRARANPQDHRARCASTTRTSASASAASIYAFPSDDTQWSLVAGAKERVESQFDYEYQTGRLRNTALSFNTSIVYDRSGTPRFYGIGNNSPGYDVTNYTLQQKYVQVDGRLELEPSYGRSPIRCALETSKCSRGRSPASRRCKVASGRSWASAPLTKR